MSRVPTGRPRDISDEVRSQILALSQRTPPEETGLSHWSSREMANYLKQKLGISVSHNFVASLWRGHGLQPHRQGTFKLSTDPRFEEVWSVSTSTLPKEPWSSRLTRRPRSRRWTGRSRRCR
ncbi:MAG: helix-turn-helix domain-containing protein [Pseudonocardia sp.]|nr:helix-turn-helix domain-containing protein [Pseudonocardia sp.]